ncbi:site-specific DNA-methyltransferase, partial [Helicobacter marmotae]|uniref:site-specific DNA-methyltransferase n=1 Tax=Helicobacter marmotae TaxID=152490 RepID=UPI0022776072
MPISRKDSVINLCQQMGELMQDKHKLLEDLEKKFGDFHTLANLTLSNDLSLFTFLLEDSTLKETYKSRFFTCLNSTLIFNKEAFLTFLNTHILDKSYTTYSNKIGLSNKNRELIQSNTEVVLNFPFKDCILKGGQIKDKDKSEEIFFNEILASDEIDVLYAPKALQNFEFIGEHSALSDFSGSASEASLRSMSNTPHSPSSHNPKNSSQSLECENLESANLTQDLTIADSFSKGDLKLAPSADSYQNKESEISPNQVKMKPILKNSNQSINQSVGRSVLESQTPTSHSKHCEKSLHKATRESLSYCHSEGFMPEESLKESLV